MAESANSPDGYEKYAAELESLVAEQGWNLKKFRRKTWYAFKPSEYGQSAFGIGFRSDNAPYLYIKRVQSEASQFGIKMTAYHDSFDQAEYDLENGIRLQSFLKLLEYAYQRC